MHLKKSMFRTKFADQKHFPVTSAANIIQVHQQAPLISFNTYISINGMKHQKTVSTKNMGNVVNGFNKYSKSWFNLVERKVAKNTQEQSNWIRISLPKFTNPYYKIPLLKKLEHKNRPEYLWNYWKTLKPSKPFHGWATVANFSLCGNEFDTTRRNLTEKLKINPFVVKSILDSNCTRFRITSVGKTST